MRDINTDTYIISLILLTGYIVKEGKGITGKKEGDVIFGNKSHKTIRTLGAWDKV